jgi:hypothetical protein
LWISCYRLHESTFKEFRFGFRRASVFFRGKLS